MDIDDDNIVDDVDNIGSNSYHNSFEARVVLSTKTKYFDKHQFKRENVRNNY